MNFNMWKKCKVVMLSTNKANPLVLNSDGNLEHDEVLSTYGGVTQQHLYILSDDEIKYDDWCYSEQFKSVYKESDPEFANATNYLWKIVATTDHSLQFAIDNNPYVMEIHGLPKLPQSFIEHYIQQYNKGNIITEVMVEYVDNWYIHIPSGKYHDDEPVKMKGNLGEGDYYLKVNPNNTINIKSLKDSWTREEVIEIIYEVLKATGKTIRAEMKNIQTVPYIEFSGEDLDEWIGSNL